jgi:hypothetical protein
MTGGNTTRDHKEAQMQRSVTVFAAMLIVFGMVGCGDTGNREHSAIPANAALKITGNVETEVGWSEEKIRSMDTIEAESTNKQGETSRYTGVRVSDLLSKAGPNSDATTLILVADDGYSAEVPLADIQACADCIVSFRNQGGFSIVAPAFPGNVQVKGVVEIQVE